MMTLPAVSLVLVVAVVVLVEVAALVSTVLLVVAAQCEDRRTRACVCQCGLHVHLPPHCTLLACNRVYTHYVHAPTA
jgi:hypothetical protein